MLLRIVLYLCVLTWRKSCPRQQWQESVLPCPGAAQFTVIALQLVWSADCHVFPIDTESRDTSSSCQNCNPTCKWEKHSPTRASARSSCLQFEAFEMQNSPSPVLQIPSVPYSSGGETEGRYEPLITNLGPFCQGFWNPLTGNTYPDL